MNAQNAFGGVIGTTVAESQPWWPGRPDHLTSAPHMIVVVLDDTGWSDLGCFGSEISTPTIDRLARDGVRFNNFHVMPLCSPTRAALMTGRNPHSVGMRFLADADTGFPNARGCVRQDVPMLPEVLRSHGYGTYMVGKWHLTPLHEITPAGPVQNWPLALGFDKYYGFLDGCTDQYSPQLFQDNHQYEPEVDEDYHLTEDLADRAIGYIRDHLTHRSAVPFYLQFAVGATHAPFQAPRRYIDKYVDVFRKGWDATREDRLARQIREGLAPEGTTLTEPGETTPAWDSLDAETQDLYAHLQAAFAGFLEHTDEQIGRIVQELEQRGSRRTRSSWSCPTTAPAARAPPATSTPTPPTAASPGPRPSSGSISRTSAAGPAPTTPRAGRWRATPRSDASSSSSTWEGSAPR